MIFGPYQMPHRPYLKQKCSCGSQVEIDPDKSWDANGVVLEWWRTHPCPLRVGKGKSTK